jgi:hypothetical protein
MRGLTRAALRVLGGSVAVFAAYTALLEYPGALFPYSVQAGNLVLRSDKPFPASAGRRVLELAEAKLERSPLFSAGERHAVYICNERWRQVLFFNRTYGAGGVALYPLTGNVFLRDARVEENRLLSPRGMEVPGDRTLDYFVAHEITHQLTGSLLGPFRFYELPRWVREGYADYVGKGDSFDYDRAKVALFAGSIEMDPNRTGLYSRYHLSVFYALDRQHMTVEELLRRPPSEAAVEQHIRAEGQ